LLLQALPRIGLFIGVKSIKIPDDYVEKFTVANHTFLRQSVFDIKTKQQLNTVIQNKENFLYPL
jgi:hypothetical protein